MTNIKKTIQNMGWPRIIIGLFLLMMYISCPFLGLNLKAAISDTIVRFGMNVVLVLSLVPMIQAGTGLNFGMPLGVEAGLLGAVISIEMGLSGITGFFQKIFLFFNYLIFNYLLFFFSYIITS